MPPTALFSTMPPNTSMPGTAFMVSAARLAVSLMWFLITMPRMPRALARLARSMSSMLRPNTSGCVCVCMSMTPAAGLTLGGGGGNAAAWPKACVAEKAKASDSPDNCAILVFICGLSLWSGDDTLHACVRYLHCSNARPPDPRRDRLRRFGVWFYSGCFYFPGQNRRTWIFKVRCEKDHRRRRPGADAGHRRRAHALRRAGHLGPHAVAV